VLSVTPTRCEYREGHAGNVSIRMDSPTSWISAHRSSFGRYRLARCIDGFSQLSQVMLLTSRCRTIAKIMNVVKSFIRLTRNTILINSKTTKSWQTHKGGHMNQEDRQHESRRGELPVEPRMGQAFRYWRPAPEVSPDEGFRRKAETSVCCFSCFRVITIKIMNILGRSYI